MLSFPSPYSVSDLVLSLEEHLHDACDVLIKKVDKKKDKQLVFGHRQSLLDQIQSCQDPSHLLLLACLVIFQFQVLTLTNFKKWK